MFGLWWLSFGRRQRTPSVPNAGEVEKAILLQNTGRQAAVVNKIAEARIMLCEQVFFLRQRAV
tara:strand:- start:183934 stop:184122 length:189 start_codon:yes stop_codon:yes gene_type:complete